MPSKYSAKQKELGRNLLRQATYPRDALPYTPEFDRLHKSYADSGLPPLDRHTFWGLLCRAGKEGGAGNKTKAPPAPSLTVDDGFEILRLCPEGIGSRDRLPYTTEFDDMLKRFAEHTGRSMNPRDFWRVLSRLGKRSRRPNPVDAAPTEAGVPQALENHLFRMNPWWKGDWGQPLPKYRRAIYGTIVRHLLKGYPQVVVVRGVRQVGKTTLQHQVITDLLRMGAASTERVLRVQFDELESLGKLTDPVLSIVEWYEKRVLKCKLNETAKKAKPVFIFFDEVQNLRGWEAQLKALVDHAQCRVFVTGSSALRIQEGRDSLAGRLITLELGPMRLAEIAKLRGRTGIEPFQEKPDLAEWTRKQFWEGLSRYGGNTPLWLDPSFRDFSDWGGYPFCHAKKDITWVEAAQYLVEAIVTRTIDHDLNIGGLGRDRRLLKEVFRLAARDAGKTPNLSTLSKELTRLFQDPVKPTTVRKYLDFLESSMLIRIVEPLQLRGKGHDSVGKLCICDHAVRAAFLQELIPLADGPEDSSHSAVLAGFIMESIVGYYLSTFEGLALSHFPARSTEPEVDFVLNIGAVRIPIEVKYRNEALKDEHLKGLKHFISKKVYNAPFGVLVTKDQTRVAADIVAVPAKQFLLLG